MINPKTLAITEFTIPTANAQPYDITEGPDGNLWFTEYAGNKIGMINPTTHAFTESGTLPTAASQPSGITTGPDGNLWFTEYGNNKVGLINPRTLVFNEFAAPTANSQPDAITTGPTATSGSPSTTSRSTRSGRSIRRRTARPTTPSASPIPRRWGSPRGRTASCGSPIGAGVSNIGVLAPATYLSATTEPPAFVVPVLRSG